MNCTAFPGAAHYSAAPHPHPSACWRPGTSSSAATLASVHPERNQVD